mmetsp:Transcript_4806/g.13885  ORF Transcript_4806/g.13885 Transcript_4806/m.13885 type:complete len:188 (-) Transcript_4806:912-1475(-)
MRCAPRNFVLEIRSVVLLFCFILCYFIFSAANESSSHARLPPVFRFDACLQLRFNHLDGRDIIVKTKPGEVIRGETKDPDSGRSMPYMMLVSGEGMPSRGNPFVRGNLYIAFHVDFPNTLSKDVVDKLRDLLPDANMEESFDPEEVEEHFLVEADLRNFGSGGAAMSGGEYDSDDEDGRQGVQCQQS